MSTPLKAHRAILLMGMHRSGTSATTRVLNLLGVALGGDLMPAAEGNNALGFWEHRGVVAIHEELLGALNRSWQDIRPMPDNWLSSEAASNAREKLVDLLSKDFANSPLWAVKDPRLCRLLPLWQLVLADMNVEANVVFIVRNPTEVAQSLAARDGMPGGLARLSWIEHILEGEWASRNLPRAVILYDNLLQDWEGCMRQLEGELHLRWPVVIESVRGEVGLFLSTSERHYNADKAAEVELPDFVRSVYETFLEKANGYASWDKIEKVSDVYQLGAKVFLDGIEEMVRQLTTLQVTEAQKSHQLQQLEHRVDGLQVALNEVEARKFLRIGPLQGGRFKDVAKVYFRPASGTYSEESSAQFVHEGLHGVTRIQWTLQAPAGFDFIRFDPSEFPGEFLLRDLQINGNKIDCMENSFAAVNQYVVREEPSGWRFASSDGDPFVELDTRNLTIQHDAAVVVELTCQRLTPGDELRHLIESALQAAAVSDSARQAESLRLQQGTHTRLDLLVERLALSDANHTNALAHVTDRVEHFVAQRNTIADQYATAAAVREQAARDELRTYQQATQSRLEAMELRLAETSQALASQLTAVQDKQAAQQGDIRDSVASLAEVARQSSQEYAKEMLHLRQQTSDIISAQRDMDTRLDDLGPKLETQATLCGVTARQVHEISSQQDATMATLDAMNALFRELSEFQRRSFMVRLRQGMSKKHPPGV